MLERMSRFYGKKAAVCDLIRNARHDVEFVKFAHDVGDELEQFHEDLNEFFDFDDFIDHLVDCWEEGYDAYKRGEFI